MRTDKLDYLPNERTTLALDRAMERQDADVDVPHVDVEAERERLRKWHEDLRRRIYPEQFATENSEERS